MPLSIRARQAGSVTAPWSREPKSQAPPWIQTTTGTGLEAVAGSTRSIRSGRYPMTLAYSTSAYRVPPVDRSDPGGGISWGMAYGPEGPGRSCN
jgi:hypothetical protein